MAGQYGSSRQGIAQGLAIGQSQQGLSNSLANLYGNAYESDQNRGVQTRGQDLTYNLGMTNAANNRYGIDQNYSMGLINDKTNQRGQSLNYDVGMANANNNRYGIDINAESNRYNTNVNAGTTMRGQDLNYGLGTAQNVTAQRGQDLNYGLGTQQNDTTRMLGLGTLDNNRYATDANFYTQQRGQDQSGAALGAALYGQGTQGAWDPLKSANGIYGNYTGFGNTTTNGDNGGSNWQSILGGLGAGAQFGVNQGWWGSK